MKNKYQILSKRKFLILGLIFSLFLHAMVVIFIKPIIDARTKSPAIYSWLAIIKKNELFKKNAVKNYPPRFLLMNNYLNRTYFSDTFLAAKINYCESQEKIFPPRVIPQQLKSPVTQFFLWDKTKNIFPQYSENVQYKILLSPQGETIFLFPQKLTSNTTDNLIYQQYIKQSAVFLPDDTVINKKFFWTNMRGVVE